jgi:hypothetical protein
MGKQKRWSGKRKEGKEGENKALWSNVSVLPVTLSLRATPHWSRNKEYWGCWKHPDKDGEVLVRRASHIINL